MADSRDTGPAVARTCLGGLTLLLALTLSVRSVSVSNGVPAHRPAMVQAVARLFAGVTAEASEARERGAAVQAVLVAEPSRGVLPRGERTGPTWGVRVALMDLPPPARA